MFTNEDAKTREVRFLDYACGTGLVSRVCTRFSSSPFDAHGSQAFGACVTTTRGIDISEKMVAEFNRLASEASLPSSQIHAVAGNLLSDPPEDSISGSEFYNFDIAAVGLGFHHIEQHTLMLERLAGRLKQGGVLLIADFLIGKGIDEEHVHSMQHTAKNTLSVAGFTEEQMKGTYEAAGLGDFAFRVFEEKVHMEFGGTPRTRTVFLAKGTKR